MKTANPCKTIIVLEDDPNDAFFLRRSFQANGFNGDFTVLPNGQSGIDYLSGQGQFRDRHAYPLPDIVVTDLKMPGVDGFAFLRWLKEHPEFMVMPVIVLTSSGEATDVKEAYCLGANAYLRKPHTTAERDEIVRKLLNFWACCEKPQAGVHSPCEETHGA